MSYIKQNEIKKVLSQMSKEELLETLKELVHVLGLKEKSKKPRSLKGILSNTYDPKFDIDKAIKEARTNWQKDFQS